MKLTGKVEKLDIGTGAFVLRTEDGRTFQLTGGADRGWRKAGQRIEIEGEVDAQAVTAAAVGPVFKLGSYRVL